MPGASREHLIRVWWTVYLLERLCSSKLGHPNMLRDEDISTPLPSSSGLSETERPQFPPPGILIAQLKLANVVTCITQDLYIVPWKSQKQSFLQNVQRIFGMLKDWNDNLPTELKVDVEKPCCRSIASLQLLFNQVWHLSIS